MMNQVFTIYSIFFLAAALLSFFVALLAWQRRSVKGARELTWLTVASGVWAFWIIFETAAHTVDDKIFWAKLEYFGAVTTPVLYLVFVLRFTGKDKFMTFYRILILFLIPAITLLLAITNEHHYLVWSGYSAIFPGTNLMEYFHGIWFWIGYMAYNNLILLIATVYLFRFIAGQPGTFRSQGVVVFFAGLCPWIASALYLTGINPVPGLDITPFSIILSATFLAYAILYIRFLDLLPVAREMLVETLSDGILALDGQNRIQDINQAALSFLGISLKNVTGIHAMATHAAVTSLLDAALSHEPVDQIEVQKGSVSCTYSITKQKIRNQSDSRLVVIRDITGQVAREREIRAGEERYHTMFTMFRLMADNMPDMLWAKDLDKKFIFTNKAICENLLHAADTDEPTGKTDLFFALRERSKHDGQPEWHTFGEMCQDSDQSVIESGKAESFDEFGNVNGRFLYLDARKAPIVDENGIMIGVVGSARDVTKQKKTEADLIAAKEKAEQSDRLKSAFLANMSHEIRTPMNAITGFARLLIDPGISEEERHRFANIIQTRSDDLMRIINDILEISRIESGNATIEKDNMNITGLLRELETVTKQKMERLNKSHISLSCEFPPQASPLFITSDQFIIKQVYTNLIDNALKFTESGSIRFGYHPPENGMLTCFVTDTGIGISPGNHRLIFEHFRQADGHNIHLYGGTGLGLSICKGSLELLGGEIRVNSTPGGGSTFYFTIPFLPPAAGTPHPPPQTGSQGLQPETASYRWPGKRFLLVEDEDTNMKLLRAFLARTEAELVCVSCGTELRQLYDRLETFDIVLLDIRLPDANGWDLAKELKLLQPDLPIIAQTAYAMSGDIEKSLGAGCNDHISKPVNKELLLQKIAEYL